MVNPERYHINWQRIIMLTQTHQYTNTHVLCLILAQLLQLLSLLRRISPILAIFKITFLFQVGDVQVHAGRSELDPK